MNKMTIRLVLAAALVAILLLLTGCDGVIAVKGTVYEWVNALPNAQSIAYLDEQYPSNMQTLPVSSAVIRVSEEDSGKPGRLIFETKTDNNGIFSDGGVAAPGKTISCIIQIYKDGYLSASKEFVSPTYDKATTRKTSYAYQHAAEVFLVKKP